MSDDTEMTPEQQMVEMEHTPPEPSTPVVPMEKLDPRGQFAVPLVGTEHGTLYAVPAAPTEIPVAVQQPSVGFYGKTNAPHGVRQPVEASKYECSDCAHLEARVRKAFKDLGHEF